MAAAARGSAGKTGRLGTEIGVTAGARWASAQSFEIRERLRQLLQDGRRFVLDEIILHANPRCLRKNRGPIDRTGAQRDVVGQRSLPGIKPGARTFTNVF